MRRSNRIMLEDQSAECQKPCQGQAIVEFAVVLPILLLLMLGLINLGVLINAQIILTQAAWEGARAGTILDSSMGEGDAEITGAVRAALTGLSDPATVTVNINPAEPARAAMPWPKPRGEPLTVRLAYPMNLALPLPITIVLGAEATSRIEYSN
ncbi:MAG: pilus assembly protein [Anaerolineales bacterium]|nr:pilus assembly protein [Anaerolineales bacterium]